MRIDYLLFLLLRFIHPQPAEEPEWPPILEEPEIVMEETEEPSMVSVRTPDGWLIIEEGLDGTDVDLAELDLY